jgi:hypothetical protein
MLLYADEDFAHPAVEELHRLGHDVVTAQEDGHSSASDSIILGRANSLGRILLTSNRKDFKRLHRQGAAHCGIISATHDPNHVALAGRIDAALVGVTGGRWHLRINRPP